MLLRPLALLALALMVAGPAAAGTLTCGGGTCTGDYSAATYANAKCPAPPEVPKLKSGDKASYDKSVEAAKAYATAASARINCIIDEANKDADQIQAAIQAGVKQQRDDAQANVSAVQTSLNNLPRH